MDENNKNILPENPDDFEEDFDEEENDDEEEIEFDQHGLPNGIFIAGTSSVPLREMPKFLTDIFGAHQPDTVNGDFKIFGGDWVFRIVDVLTTKENNVNTISIEVFPIIKHNKRPKIEITDVYKFLKDTHLINFILSTIKQTECFLMEDDNISCMIHEDQVSNFISFRIIITNVTTTFRDWIMEALHEYQISSNTEVINFKKNTSFIRQIKKCRHMYEPLILYEITATASSKNIFTFSNPDMDFGELYNIFFKTPILDGIQSFYGYSNDICQYIAKHHNLIRIGLSCAMGMKTIKFHLVCTPGVVPVTNGELRSYWYDRNMISQVGLSKINDELIPDIDGNSMLIINRALTQFMYSDFTQIFVTETDFIGHKCINNGLSSIYSSKTFLFNCGINLQMNENFTFSHQEFEEEQKILIIPCDQVISTKNRETIKCYWKIKAGVFNLSYSGIEIRIYGLVEVDLLNLSKKGIINLKDILVHLVRDDNADDLLGFKVPSKKKLFSHEEHDFSNFVLIELAVGIRENINIARYAIIEIIREEKVE